MKLIGPEVDDHDMIFKTNVEVGAKCTECIVVLKETFHPSWRVTVDKIRHAIHRLPLLHRHPRHCRYSHNCRMVSTVNAESGTTVDHDTHRSDSLYSVVLSAASGIRQKEAGMEIIPTIIH